MKRDNIMSFFCQLLLTSLFFILTETSSYGQKLDSQGRLVGTVLNESNEKLTGATVSIKSKSGKSISITTNINGIFEYDLNPGLYTLVISYAGYQTSTDSNIVISKGEVFKQTYVLNYKRASGEVVITASKRNKESISSVLSIQKNAVAVADVISAEQIKRTPDVTVGDAVRRMNGVTVVDNKFIVVRGMSDRYNTVLLNGSPVPSTEAGRKNFSLDLIPSNAIDNIIISKTATPDLPADFSGGIVQVSTKEVPDKNSFSFTAGLGYNTISTGREFLSTKIYRRQYLSLVHPTSKWYFNKWNPNRYALVKDQRAMGASIPNTWGLYRYLCLPTQSYQINAAIRKKLSNGASLGVLVAGSYRNEQSIADDLRQINGNEDSTSGKLNNFSTDVNLIGSINYSYKKSKFNFRNFYSRKLSQDVALFSGFNTNRDSLNAYSSLLNLVTIYQSRLEGEHQLNFYNLRIKWFGDISTVNRDLVDGRTSSRFSVNGSMPFYFFSDLMPTRGGVSASKFKESRQNAGLELSLPFKLLDKKHNFKIGGNFSNREVESYYSFLRHLYDPKFSVTELKEKEIGLPLDLILTRQNVGNGFSYVPVSSTSAPIANGNSVGGSSLTFADYYKGIQTNTAYYFMTDFNITNYLRFIGGVRNEINIMTINTVTQRDTSGNPLSFVQTKIEQNALFPSANLVYKLNQESNIRAAYSQTTARPDFREAVPLGYYDFVNFNNVIGNPNIKNTLIHNYDLRYEFFPKPQEVISVTVFYKNFIDPIEQNLTDDGSGNFIVAPVNLKSSQNLGFELDARKSLSFFRPTSKFFKDLYVYGNYSQMSSEVELATSLSDSVKKDTRRRPLQGLSPYSINLGLIYNGNKYGFNLVYNRFGRRLLFQGDFAFQDIYENPRDVVDIQLYARALRNKMEIKLNISDILNQPFILYSNSADKGNNRIDEQKPNNDPNYSPSQDYLRRSTIRGTGISVSINYKL